MKEGILIRRFRAKDDREVSLRAPKWSDLDDMLELVNSLVEEGANIGTTEKLSRDDEVDWLAKHLTDVEKDKKVAIVAEVGGKFIGQIEVRPMSGSSRHVGFLVIAISDGYRNISIGTEMMKEAEAQARRLGLEALTLEVFANNDKAIHLFEKMGYLTIGRFPNGFQKRDLYIDKILMSKKIKRIKHS